MQTPHFDTTITLPNHHMFLQTKHQVTRRKPINTKGVTPPIRKKSRRELIAVERAFVAGACIAGSLSHNDCAQLCDPNVASKSTITRTIQRANERVNELNTTIIDPRCFEFSSKRGPPRLLTGTPRKHAKSFCQDAPSTSSERFGIHTLVHGVA
jgi:hypothetical protein